MRTEPRKKLKILIVDDHPLVLEGLRACLSGQKGIGNIYQATNGEEALQNAHQHAPDVVLMDITLPRMSGLMATRRIVAAVPKTRVAMLTVHDNHEYAAEALRAGASGYILKNCSPDELLRAIMAVYNGEKFFSTGLSKVVISDQGTLSDRELQVLARIADGLTNKEIAHKLHISVRTVETHRERIMNKLHVHSVAGLTKYALARGIVATDA